MRNRTLAAILCYHYNCYRLEVFLQKETFYFLRLFCCLTTYLLTITISLTYLKFPVPQSAVTILLNAKCPDFSVHVDFSLIVAESQQLKSKWQTEVGECSEILWGNIPLNSKKLFSLNLFNNGFVSLYTETCFPMKFHSFHQRIKPGLYILYTCSP